MIYGDSSFLLAIYHRGDRFHSTARKLASQFHDPIPLTPLGELELLNGAHRCLAAGTVTIAERDSILRQIADDESDGILFRPIISQFDLHEQARKLSNKYTPQISSRTLDIFHVAAAQILRASTFISFDIKQRMLAQKVGLSLQPNIVRVK